MGILVSVLTRSRGADCIEWSINGFKRWLWIINEDTQWIVWVVSSVEIGVKSKILKVIYV